MIAKCEDLKVLNSNSNVHAKNDSYQSCVYLKLIEFVVPNCISKFYREDMKSSTISKIENSDYSHTSKPISTVGYKKTLEEGDDNNPKVGLNEYRETNSNWTYNVLDIGTGDGFSTHRLYKALLNGGIPPNKLTVIGLDILPTMTEHANRVYRESIENGKSNEIATGLHFVNADIAWDIELIQKAIWELDHGIELQRIKFDQIVSSYCFHWIKNQTKALINLRKLLSNKPGSCIDLVFSKNASGPLNYAVDRVINDPKWIHLTQKLKNIHEEYLLPWRRSWMISPDPIASYIQIMINSGYEKENIEINNLHEIKYYKFSSEKDIEDIITGCFPDVLDTTEDSVKQAFYKDLTKHMFQYNSTHDKCDPLIMSIPALHIHYVLKSRGMNID